MKNILKKVGFAISALAISLSALADSSVIYFTGSGTTKIVANKLANELKVNPQEMIALEPYTQEDLNYRNDNCRANLEMRDPNARPKIKNDLSKAVEAEDIYLGFPIWWGTNPKIIDTFAESYDLKGKKIHVFITSGGSSYDKAVDNLKNNHKLNVVSQTRLRPSDDAFDYQNFISE